MAGSSPAPERWLLGSALPAIFEFVSRLGTRAAWDYSVARLLRREQKVWHAAGSGVNRATVQQVTNRLLSFRAMQFENIGTCFAQL